MSTWRNLMTPQISKYMDSQNKNNSHLNFAETPVNMLSTLNSKEYPEILSTNRIETSEFGDGDIKRIKYQEKLNKIQREILELKKQTTISRNNELFSSQTNIISNKENYFSSSKDDLQQKDFDEKSFLKKTNGQMNFIYTNNIKENQTNKKSRKS